METSPKELLSKYSEIRECDFKERHYSVRDNGAIYRHPKKDCKPSKLDCTWTFGNKDNKTGYMLYGRVRVHQIVATAFHGTLMIHIWSSITKIRTDVTIAPKILHGLLGWRMLSTTP